MIRDHLPQLRQTLRLDFVLANGENAAGGVGLSAKSARELRRYGVDVVTSGNHIWKFPDICQILEQDDWLLRPANYPGDAVGRGLGVYSMPDSKVVVAVLNLQGRTFMDPLDCPFQAAERLLAGLPDDVVILVDFHAEATSEKRALVHMLRGRVHAVLGTHTHVQTNDACILDGKTGYMTDIGMCGPMDSCLGMDNDIILTRFRTGRPQKFKLAETKSMLCGALMEISLDGCKSIVPWKFEA